MQFFKNLFNSGSKKEAITTDPEQEAKLVMAEFCQSSEGRHVVAKFANGDIAWTLSNTELGLKVENGPAFELAKTKPVDNIYFLEKDGKAYQDPQSADYAHFGKID